ncbi:NHLP bacteriocin export ABC transporter permease/ATPase subunit [Methylobacterium nonmethylotrophicum]|uniref:NHLP bacteriocin export ABC transporter permease/ATPase subunit n=1 Tax=Methylobacterium nonmethylotrophicum TaxID=1141884 RepID=A0A4Z0NQK3_9HYPH|nr:NHLP bacteriocin export ABC transporter permease/ATPase subunit [Methylobacterium nonmethylotrophicum]TGD98060.1 NHLP bacteriocin export ABC transporter permease/ATPase subunit [Methylobacterium nonmethylotrophicum]
MNERVVEPAAPSAAPTARIALDGRRPERLDGRDRPLVIARGHADVFLVPASGEARRHLLRAEAGDLLPPLPAWPDGASRIVALGVPGTLAEEPDALPEDRLEAWILRVSALVVGLHPAWEMREIAGAPERLEPGERRRGPARSVRWVAVTAGTARPMGCGPDAEAGDPCIPLAAGLWLEAGDEGCTLAQADPPTGPALHQALDRFHACAFAGLAQAEAARLAAERARLARRRQVDAARASDLLERLAGLVVRRRAAGRPLRDGGDARGDAHFHGDALLAACDLVAATLPARLARRAGRARRPEEPEDPFAAVLELARASRLRVRRTLLRGAWWRGDQGALLAWHGEAADPVALLPDRRGYVMVDPARGHRRRVDPSLAAGIAPEAVTFYATLPARVLRLTDLLAFAAGPARGNIARIALAALMLAALALVVPLITEVLVNSAVPRSQLDQVAVCAAALAVAAIASAAIQAAETLAMLRLEGLIDWTLQAALIDRMLRLRAELFRDYTAGDLVGRVMGIDAVRRVLTGQTLRNLLAGLSCAISIGLMLYYDARLALVGLGLALLRGLLIAAAAGFRLRHEGRHFEVQGRESGFILQLFAGIPKLRVANAATRALAVWSELFAAQKAHHVAAQRVANRLATVEAAFPTLATLAIFAAAMQGGSSLTRDLGAFLAFFAAFGQAMARIGAWASGISELLVAVPHVARLRPLLAAEPEVAEDRKPAGDLTGAVELSRVTFRYGAAGPPVLDDVSLSVAPGEYVAIVGPSGGGKSSLFRLLLGFERPEAGAVFYDDKALDTLDVGTVRRQLGVVLQNGRLTTGSLYENICGGVPLPMEQALEAARLAGLEADIQALPMGLHTMVAEGVNTFSGGQRQRLLIARAIARRPRILLLDEATSALDNASQAVVSASLGALNVTRIVIAHRLSTVREADRIVVLVNGRIVQSGRYAELSAAPGVFAQFAERQLL